MAPLQTGLFLGGSGWHDEDDQDITATDEDGSEYEDAADDADDEDDVPYYNPQTGAHSLKRQRSPVADDGEGSKRLRTPGGDAAAAGKGFKDFKAEQDRRITTLKKQGYADAYVADKLREEGLGSLGVKAIAPRWRDLRKKEEAKEDAMLDDELSDWHQGEDDELHEAYNAIEENFTKDLAKLNEKKWRDVSQKLAGHGTALLPIEIDPDQAGRAALRQQRIEEAKARRAAAAEAVKHAEDQKKLELQAKEDEKLRYWQAKEDHKKTLEAKRIEEKRFRDEHNAAKERERAARAAALQRIRGEADEKKKVKEAEERVFRYYTGRYLVRVQKRRRNPDDEEDYTSDESDGYDMSDLADSDQDEASVSSGKPYTKHTTEEKKPATTFKPAKVNKESLLNPRSVMSDEELEMLLHERDHARRANKETHPQVVARLAVMDWSLTTSELNGLLEKRFASRKGKQAVRIARLQQYDAANSVAGQDGVKSTDLEFKQKYEGYTGKYKSLIDED
ncbi:hypothetical protein LTR37_017991 [Vermiconidia calcicola]|uniref:Uncharacterized protein n=1 Tax=Vermiconidia calcicola TaxID=1690605 RepID=A0ACC3MJQ7_9PEZI|nr:hypothetical protein LTR37_017991 [Vermiconidia calcicola]